MYITAYFKTLVMPDMQSDQDHKSPGLETSGISAVTYVLIQNWNLNVFIFCMITMIKVCSLVVWK